MHTVGFLPPAAAAGAAALASAAAEGAAAAAPLEEETGAAAFASSDIAAVAAARPLGSLLAMAVGLFLLLLGGAVDAATMRTAMRGGSAGS